MSRVCRGVQFGGCPGIGMMKNAQNFFPQFLRGKAEAKKHASRDSVFLPQQPD